MSDVIDEKVDEGIAVKRRDESFAKSVATKIYHEKPHPDNPYVAQSSYCYGYNLVELMSKRSYVDVMYLLFKGELPNKEQAQLFEKLMIALINPGARHPAVRAAMNAGIGKTNSAHILPIGLMVLGGEHLGAVEVEASVRWLRKNIKKNPADLVDGLLESYSGDTVEDEHPVPGFGSRYGAIDLISGRLLNELTQLPGAGEVMHWAKLFGDVLKPYKIGCLNTGLAAAVFCDLGFQPRVTTGLYQVLSAPGIFAHGIEQSTKPFTAMPFPDDKDYHIEK